MSDDCFKEDPLFQGNRACVGTDLAVPREINDIDNIKNIILRIGNDTHYVEKAFWELNEDLKTNITINGQTFTQFLCYPKTFGIDCDATPNNNICKLNKLFCYYKQPDTKKQSCDSHAQCGDGRCWMAIVLWPSNRWTSWRI